MYPDYLRKSFKDSFDAYKSTLFVVAAGNCGKTANGPQARESIRDALPTALANDSQYPTSNVIAISATVKSSDGTRRLATYSAPDGTFAAPGGGGQAQVTSAAHTCTSFLGVSCQAAGTAQKSGTSMAAPYVTGVVGLMLNANPFASTEHLKACLIQSATTSIVGIETQPISPVSVHELNAATAVTCAKNLGKLAGVTQISVGDTHACALVAGGTVKCWGTNMDGELGDGTNNTSSWVPTDVLAG
jgi:subtilisin family serine protease